MYCEGNARVSKCSGSVTRQGCWKDVEAILQPLCKRGDGTGIHGNGLHLHNDLPHLYNAADDNALLASAMQTRNAPGIRSLARLMMMFPFLKSGGHFDARELVVAMK